MKTGPRGGMYERMLDNKFKGNLPRCPARLQRKNPREASRRKAIRAIHRREMNPEKYQNLAKWVREMRAYTKKSRFEFAKLVGVSRSTLIRWELALGHMPAEWGRKNRKGKIGPSTMERLELLSATIRELKKTNTPFEG